MTSSRLPEKPLDLFDLANQVVDALAGNATFANLKTALELMTKLTAAMYAYGAYLAIEDGAKHSPFARGLLKHAAQRGSAQKKSFGSGFWCSRITVSWRGRVGW